MTLRAHGNRWRDLLACSGRPSAGRRGAASRWDWPWCGGASKGFAHDTRAAATSLVAAFVSIMAVGASALLIEHVWLVDQRDTLKAASNAAAIAGTLEMRRALADDPDIGHDELKAALKPSVEGFVLANLLHLSEDRFARAKATLVIEVRPDRDQGTVNVKTRADLGGFLFATTLPFLSGVTQVEAMETGARVESVENPIEVVLAIDVSSSMESGLTGRSRFSRMEIVKQAAKDLVAILNPSADNRVAIGVVPWHYLVRLDDTAMSEWGREGWVDYPRSRRYAFAYACNTNGCTSLDETQALPADPGEEWLGCLGEHRVSLDGKADLPDVRDLFAHPSDSAFAQSVFPALYGAAYECLQPPVPGDLGFQSCYGTAVTKVPNVSSEMPAQPGCDNDDRDEDTPTMLPLTSDRTVIEAAIESMEPKGSMTYSALGVAWGQRMLSHAWNDVWGGGDHPVNPDTDGNAGTRKAIVLLTDGEDNRCGSGDETCSGRELGFARDIACTEAKAAGTEIFVVAAMNPDDVSQGLGSGLEACSSQADNPQGTYVFLNNSTAENLQAAFANIANQLVTVRRVY